MNTLSNSASLLLLLAAVVRAQNCQDISGTWQVEEHSVITFNIGGQISTSQSDGAGPVTIEQNGCQIHFSSQGVNPMDGSIIELPRNGTVTDNRVTYTGQTGVIIPGATCAQNSLMGTGVIIGNTILVTNVGNVNCSVLGIPINVTVNGTAVFTRSLQEADLTGGIRLGSPTGEPLSGVTVRLTGGAGAQQTQTDSSGRYTFSGLRTGSYSVVPEKTGFIFEPSSQTVNLSEDTELPVFIASSICDGMRDSDGSKFDISNLALCESDQITVQFHAEDDSGNVVEVRCGNYGGGPELRLFFIHPGETEILVGQCCYSDGNNSWGIAHTAFNPKTGRYGCFIGTEWRSVDYGPDCKNTNARFIDGTPADGSPDLVDCDGDGSVDGDDCGRTPPRLSAVRYYYDATTRQLSRRLAETNRATWKPRDGFVWGEPELLPLNAELVCPPQSCPPPTLLGSMAQSFLSAGDFNGDGKKDAFDGAAILGIVGARRGDSNFDPPWDIDRDGMISVQDVELARLGPWLTAAPAGGNTVISWRPEFTGYNLEWKSHLTDAAWQIIGNQPTNLPLSQASGFLRLRK